MFVFVKSVTPKITPFGPSDPPRTMLATMLATAALSFSPAGKFEDLEVYHVNPAHYPAAPINMDTADALGDMYFDMRSIATPIECAHPTPSSGHDCDNQEVVANDLVITKLVLSVRKFGEYGKCKYAASPTPYGQRAPAPVPHIC